MVNKEMKFLDNGDVRYEIVDEAARSNIQTINTVLDTKADTSNVTALDTRVTGVEDDCYNSYAVGTASGAIASFTDGADDLPLKSLMIDINPVQDLHGYDSPWVAGGGKNKIPYPYYSQAGTLDGVTYTIGDDGKLTATGTTERGTNFFFVRNVVLTAGTYTASVSGDFVGPTFMIYDQVNKVTICNILPAESTHYKTFTIESDKTVNIYLNTSQTGLTFNVSAYFQLEQGSTATAYTPYKNICPISGWTEVDVYDDSLYGGNIEWNQLIRNGNFSEGREYFSSNNCSLSASGGVLTVTANAGTSNKNFSVDANTSIYSAVGHKYFYSFWVKVSTTSIGARFAFTPLANNGLMTNALTANVDTHIQGIKECTTSAKARMYWYPWGSSTYDTTGTEYAQVHDVILIDLTEMFGAGNEPSTVEEFRVLFPNDYYEYNDGEKTTVSAVNGKPYTQVNIPLGQTVYGGKLNVLTGELTVDKAMVDLRTLNWTYTSDTGFDYNFFTCSSFTNRKRGSVYLICDRYATASGGRNTMTSDAMISSYNATNSQSICIRDDRYTTVSDFVASLDGAQLVYELATPITIQLTSHEVNSLYGTNNIFADTGDIDVEYKADTTLYIERLIESNVDRAEEAKIDAQNSATQAEQSASQALTYKTDTESARDEVQSIVDSISVNANQIDTNTENIASLEEDRYKPYVTDSASGAIASFTDGADDLPLKSLVVNIDPVQDLHGYDSPWVGGTGVNLLKPVETTVTSNGIVATGYEDGKVTVTGTATSDVQVELFLVSVTEKRYYLILKDDISGSADTWWVSISGVAPIYSGHVNSANFYSAGNYKLRINVKSGITINQTFYPMIAESETTYSPYENICPISGWEEMTVNASGKNLLDKSKRTVLSTNLVWGADSPIAYANGSFWLNAGTYTFSCSETMNGLYVVDAEQQIAVAYSSTSLTFTLTKRTPIKLQIYKNGGTAEVMQNIDCWLTVGSTATDYEPYNGQTIPIDWQSEAGTVYGGYLDVLTGILTVDMAMVDLGTLNWTYDAPIFYTMGLVDSIKQPLVNTTPFLCSNYNAYPSTSRTTMKSTAPNGSFTITSSGNIKNVVVKDSSYTDAATFKTAMSGVQLCYELATPITIQLTPHEVKSLLGANNIFADTGDCSVEYRADTKLYIERLTAPDSADMIADSNIVSGQYFMVSNALYKATTNIANGGQIIVGTNCTKVSLATALNEINA